jgi:hypothetical protein
MMGVKSCAEALTCVPQLVTTLPVQPCIRRATKQPRQAKRHVRIDRTLSDKEARRTIVRHVNRRAELLGCEPVVIEELRLQRGA